MSIARRSLPALAVAGCTALQPARAQPAASLRDLAHARGLTFGSAIRHDLLRTDAGYAALMAREAEVLVPEWAAKWSVLQPREGEFDFSVLQEILAFAARNRQRVRGHTLLWHESLPAWLPPALAEGPARAGAVMETHIRTVLEATRPSIRDWDVLNEVVANPPGSDNPSPIPGDLRTSPWLRALGPDYIDRAFRIARQVDPTLRLTLNDYGVEADNPAAAEKRARLLRLVRGMIQRRVPLDAIGIQAHLQMREPFRAEPLVAWLQELRGMGLALAVTELDVREPDVLAPSVALRDAAVADRTAQFLEAAIAGGVRTILTWGLSDRDSWLRLEPSVARPDGAQTRGLPFDTDLRPKPMREAMARVFRG